LVYSEVIFIAYTRSTACMRVSAKTENAGTVIWFILK